MAIEADKIWLDGELVDFDKANVHVLTHSLHYGLARLRGDPVLQARGRSLGDLPVA